MGCEKKNIFFLENQNNIFCHVNGFRTWSCQFMQSLKQTVVFIFEVVELWKFNINEYGYKQSNHYSYPQYTQHNTNTGMQQYQYQCVSLGKSVWIQVHWAHIHLQQLYTHTHLYKTNTNSQVDTVFISSLLCLLFHLPFMKRITVQTHTNTHTLTIPETVSFSLQRHCPFILLILIKPSVCMCVYINRSAFHEYAADD